MIHSRRNTVCRLISLLYVTSGIFLLSFWWFLLGVLAGFPLDIAITGVQLAPDEVSAG